MNYDTALPNVPQEAAEPAEKAALSSTLLIYAAALFAGGIGLLVLNFVGLFAAVDNLIP